MISAFRGGAIILSGLVLAGCIAPMRQREAESRAGQSLRSFCRDKACGAPHLVKTQKLKNRWLVDFETAGGLYTVAVDQGGNTDVSVWDKNSPR
jgi:hypothetical protein